MCPWWTHLVNYHQMGTPETSSLSVKTYSLSEVWFEGGPKKILKINCYMMQAIKQKLRLE